MATGLPLFEITQIYSCAKPPRVFAGYDFVIGSIKQCVMVKQIHC
jgi:hypothetical protein